MTLTVPAFVGFLVVTGALIACASSQAGQPLYAEYSLDATEHPESIDCFYACLRSTREEFRDVCLSGCEGVVATTTATPCAPGSRALCRGYRVAEEQTFATAEYDADYDDSGSQAAGLLVELFAAGIDAALSGDGDGNRSSSSAGGSERRSSSSPKARPARRKTSSSSKPNLEKGSGSSKSSVARKSKAGSTLTPILRSKSKRD
jgi:hypothetical protein